MPGCINILRPKNCRRSRLSDETRPLRSKPIQGQRGKMAIVQRSSAPKSAIGGESLESECERSWWVKVAATGAGSSWLDACFVTRVSVAERCFPIVDKSGVISTVSGRYLLQDELCRRPRLWPANCASRVGPPQEDSWLCCFRIYVMRRGTL
jgi:hypothetical protein